MTAIASKCDYVYELTLRSTILVSLPISILKLETETFLGLLGGTRQTLGTLRLSPRNPLISFIRNTLEGTYTHNNYKKANKAPRCNHILPDGRRCSQPALRLRRFCRLHDTALNVTRLCDLPPVDSAEGIQTAIAQVVSAMLEGRMDRRKGDLCLQGLRLAHANLFRLRREQQQDRRHANADDQMSR